MRASRICTRSRTYVPVALTSEVTEIVLRPGWSVVLNVEVSQSASPVALVSFTLTSSTERS